MSGLPAKDVRRRGLAPYGAWRRLGSPTMPMLTGGGRQALARLFGGLKGRAVRVDTLGWAEEPEDAVTVGVGELGHPMRAHALAYLSRSARRRAC